MTCPYAVLLGDDLQFDADWHDDGFFWVWDTLDGWFGQDVKASFVDLAGDIGQVAGEVRRSSKTITLKGFIGVKDGDDWWRAATALEDAVNVFSDIGAPATLIVDEPDAPKQLTVFCNGRLLITRSGRLRAVGATNVVTAGVVFQMSLIAPDPRKTLVP